MIPAKAPIRPRRVKVKCNRCKNVHMTDDRVMVRDKKESYKHHSSCPRCNARVYIELKIIN